jgi:hypothetical protein
MKSKRSRFAEESLREPTIVLLAIVALCSIYASWYPARNAPAIDFYQFWVVGQEVSAGQPGNIFSDLERERIGQRFLEKARTSGDRSRLRTARQRASLDTYSTPFLYAVFSSFSSGDYQRDLLTYRALSLLCLVFSVTVLCRLLAYPLVPTLVMIPLFASWFVPSLSDMSVGNVNHFQLAGLVLFLWLSHRFPTTTGHLLGGFLLGLGALFKPNTALVIGMLMLAWMVGRQYKKLGVEMAGIAMGTLVAFAWSSLAFGRVGIWPDWLAALSGLPDRLITFELGNYAPLRLLKDSMGIEATWWIALVFVGLALAAIARGRSRASQVSAMDDILIIALAGIATLLSSPLSWLHYFVAAIPMLLITLRPIRPIRPTPEGQRGGTSWALSRVVAMVALVAVMIRPLVMLGIGEPRHRAVLLCVATATLFVLGLRELIKLQDDPSGELTGSAEGG